MKPFTEKHNSTEYEYCGFVFYFKVSLAIQRTWKIKTLAILSYDKKNQVTEKS